MVLKLGRFGQQMKKYLESSEMWCWGRTEKISWTDRVGYEEVLHRVKVERSMLHAVKGSKAEWIGQILRRNCFLNKLSKERWGGIELTGRKET